MSHVFSILRNLFWKNLKEQLSENHLTRFVSDCQGCGCRMHTQRGDLAGASGSLGTAGSHTHTKGGIPADPCDGPTPPAAEELHWNINAYPREKKAGS